MIRHGFVRVAAAVPRLRVADCAGNAAEMLALLEQAEARQTHVVVFPELALTGYTCADLFQQPVLLRGARNALAWLIDAGSQRFAGICFCNPTNRSTPWLNTNRSLNKGHRLG